MSCATGRLFLPELDVTTRPTLYVPFCSKTCVTLGPVASERPSPSKSQAYPTRLSSSLVACEPSAEKATLSGAAPYVVEAVIAATGESALPYSTRLSSASALSPQKPLPKLKTYTAPSGPTSRSIGP